MKNMRVIKRQMSDEQALELLKKGEYGVLSTVNAENQPFGTPLSYIFMEGSVYFHCAIVGTKLDNIKNNSKVCFTVIGKTQILPEQFSTNYESVMVFGNATLINGDEKVSVFKEILKKYSNDYYEEGMKYIEKAKDKATVVKINIDSFTGKHRI